MTRESFQFPGSRCPRFSGYDPMKPKSRFCRRVRSPLLEPEKRMTRESFQFPACFGVPDFQGFIPRSGNRGFAVGCDRHCIYRRRMTRKSFQFPPVSVSQIFRVLSDDAEIAVLPSGAIATAVTQSL